MITNRIFLGLTLALLVSISTTAVYAQAGEPEQLLTPPNSLGGLLDVLEQAKLSKAQRFEGSWAVTVTPVIPGVPQPASFRAAGTVSRGGGYFGSDRNRPFSKQHGAWVHLGSDDFAYTVNEDLYDAMGVFRGTLVVRVKLTITGNDTFVGVSNGEERDAFGNLVSNRCATVRGERIKVEPLSLQCQSILPPQ